MELETGISRLLAPNPSPMTFQGTNTYLLGHDDVVVIDPGPDHAGHLEAILNAIAGRMLRGILVTHSHLDHSPLARPLALRTGAPILAAGPSDWGRSPVMDRLATEGSLGGGEGIDEAFTPDETLRNGDSFEGIEVLETPGHMANHLSFAWKGALFSGDLVMGWATSLVSPPDGDMTAFYASLDRLSTRSDRIFYPGHGDPVENPQARVTELAGHRRGREAAILKVLAAAPATAQDLAQAIYTDVDPRLLPMAERNVLAHLIDLEGRNEIETQGPIAVNSRFSIAEK